MRFGDAERRWRLADRHHLDRSASSPEEVVEAVSALHSSDPLTPFLSCWARIPDFSTADLERQLYVDRSLWRMHTIRRTLFVLRSAEAPVFEAAASRHIARKERARLEGWMSGQMAEKEFEAWLERLFRAVLEALDGLELSTRELSGLIPELGRTLTIGSGRWAATVPVSSRVLYLMGMEGLLVRGRPAGTWRSSQYRWASVRHWFGAELDRLEEDEARALLARRYLETHGPATMADLRWWTGWTLAAAKRALSQIDAATVELDSGEAGLIVSADYEAEPRPSPVVAFLPALDSTTMGWKDRTWYLGDQGTELFDSNGNAGPTVWVDGSVVGGWGQLPDGSVVHHLFDEVGADVSEQISTRAEELSRWLDGTVVMPRFPSPLGRRLAG